MNKELLTMDIHGHSHGYSEDGRCDAWEIVEAAGDRGLYNIGLSDHKCTRYRTKV